ncbi:conserved hypothetical protein [Uncinocarpus reesii 1704]|uniref:ferric-chelate reductase (NADPH) n=1 Tax=Uncinocarpus reesii (strain UAMH 1704) TaxID=336963 RepID=C4JPC3_UNCRE|nr:uncharacterized protein UREG_04505 [Uncinocarpus reesii 1704]EEP79659.1 conserved hypothetical protein [Uncinocarpus reesii 1704]
MSPPFSRWEAISAGLTSRKVHGALESLAKRIDIPFTSMTTPSQIEASTQDPFNEASKYALGWVYFSIVLLVFTFVIRSYHIWGDKIRAALYKEELRTIDKAVESDQEMVTPATANSTSSFFPVHGALPPPPKRDSSIVKIRWLNYTIAFVRWIFYRPLPVMRIWKLEIVPPPLAAIVIVSFALIFVTLYSFLPQPLFYKSIKDGSPPLAIRAGMIAVSLVPWIVALSMKANLISMLTGIGHERLNVLHRWAGYICMFLALVHMIPFYITPVWEDGALELFRQFIKGDFYIYGSGLAALVPLGVLCLHSLPFLRNRMYELFVTMHAPIAMVFVGMMFWHCANFLTSWHYLFTTVAIWLVSYGIRLFYLNWTNPFRLSFLIGEESAVTILPENAVKVTIPTQMRWRPGQYVYLRMPGISVFENHPFTIASLCSDDFPSSYGEEYRDMTLVFRPFSGFTNKVLNTALIKGPYKTYRAFIDGPYGGMRRELAAFDHVVFFAGGSGITAIASQLLDLIRRMRDRKALTRTVRVVWALKRPETMEWFKEELRICREYAPPGTVCCQFYITGSKRYTEQPTPSRPHSGAFHDKINDVFQGVASKRTSAFIREEAAGDEERENELRRENEDTIAALPSAYVPPQRSYGWNFPTSPVAEQENSANSMNFGFPSTPTLLQKNLMRFAFFPTQKRGGWRTEYGRPDIPFMLRQYSKDFGRRTCVFVCGPPTAMASASKDDSNTKPTTTPTPFLSLSPAHLARLQPHTYVYAHLNPSPDSSRPSVRINGRTEFQFRPVTVNTGSLTHANGSAVVRIGDMTAVCAVRGEILSTNDIPAWKVSSGSTEDRNKKGDEGKEAEEEEDDSEIHTFNLLVPNLSLSTGCSPSILPGSAPTSLAQSLSHRLLSLLHSSRLIRASDLRIWSNPNPTQAQSQEQHEDAEMENTSVTSLPETPEVKGFWTLYIDVLIISMAGNPFDAAWAAIIAALRDTRLPKAWWDIENEMVLCSDRVSDSRKLQLRGMPIPSSFAVFEADPVGDWRKVMLPARNGKTKDQGQIKRWILADPDAFEESLCQERFCIMVDKDADKPEGMKILMMEKSGGFYIGKDEMTALAHLATGRWEEWRALLEGLG